MKKTMEEKYGKVVAKVVSDNLTDVYDVRKLAKGKWFCDCKAWRFSYKDLEKLEKKMPCKHMLRTWHLWKETKGRIPQGLGVIILDNSAFKR